MAPPSPTAARDRATRALRQTLADVRRSAALRRRISLPNARRLYLRRAGDHARLAHLAQITAICG
jgi:hypothetical protein